MEDIIVFIGVINFVLKNTLHHYCNDLVVFERVHSKLKICKFYCIAWSRHKFRPYEPVRPDAVLDFVQLESKICTCQCCMKSTPITALCLQLYCI